MKVECVVPLVPASCLLHNISEVRRDPPLDKWFEQDQDSAYPQAEDENYMPFRMNTRERAEASDTRNILADFVYDRRRKTNRFKT